MDIQEGARTGLYDDREKQIMSNDIGRRFNLHKKEYEEKAIEILRSGWYVLEKEVEAFEQEWADYCGGDD